MTEGRLEIDVALVVRELWNGDAVAWPPAQPDLIAYGADADDCLEQQRRALGDHLQDIEASELSRFTLPPDASLREVEVHVKRVDLPKSLQMLTPLSLPCLFIPAAKTWWSVVLPLLHTVYLSDRDDVNERIEQEVQRIVAGRELAPHEDLALLPARSTRLTQLTLRLERQALDSADRAIARGRQAQQAQRLKTARRVLGRVATPLSDRYRDHPVRLIGREGLRAQLDRLLCGPERLAVATIGPELVGKSAVLVEALRHRADVYVTSGAELIAGQSGFGQWQAQLHAVLSAAELVDAVLYFDNLADLFAGRNESEDMASLIRPYLEEQKVRLVGELHTDQVEIAESRNPGFFRALHPVRVEPLEVDATREIIRGYTAHYAALAEQSGQPIPNLSADAIEPLLLLCARYLPYQEFPGKAVRLLEELRASQTQKTARADGLSRSPIIGPLQIYRGFSVRTGIPTILLREDRALKLAEIRRAFSRRLIGQTNAMQRVAETICTIKAELQPAGKPLATFLFAGPTGVGKTELARTLTEFLFGSEDRLVRFDMSEYADPLAADRLIRGSQRDDGLLTRRVRQQPFCVVLLDEIEKADRAVFDLLLQVCGEGRLSDARGRTTWFHNAIIVMTSNLGAAARKQKISGFTDSESPTGAQQYYEGEVRKHFRPEFVNRLDQVIAFETLKPKEVRKIANILVGRLGLSHGLGGRNLTLSVSDRALDFVAKEGYSPTFGARQLRRAIDLHLVGPLSRGLAEMGAGASGGRVEVVHTDEDIPKELSADAFNRYDGENLRVFVTRATRQGTSRSLHSVDATSALRRSVHRRMRSVRCTELSEALDLATAQLHALQGRAHKLRGDRRAAADLQVLYAKHASLSAAWAALEADRRDVDTAEELGITEAFEGGDAAPYLQEAQTAHASFEVHLLRALFALETAQTRNQICLKVYECDQLGGLDLWLAPLLDFAESEDWLVEGHVRGELPLAHETWPIIRPFGPARGVAALRALLERNEDKRRGLLLAVRGDFAGVLLAMEVGLHRYRHAKTRRLESPAETIHLLVENVRMAFARDDLLWRNDFVKEVPQRGLREHQAANATREYDFKRSQLTVGPQYVRDARPPKRRIMFGDYWAQIREIALQHAWQFEIHAQLNREAQLFGAMTTRKSATPEA